MKTVELEEAARDLEALFREAASGERIVIKRGTETLGTLEASNEAELETTAVRLDRLAREGRIIRSSPDAQAIRRSLSPIGEGTGTWASDWIIHEERADRC